MADKFSFFWLLFLYTVGGAASLAYQVVLQRQLTQLIGIDVYSVTLIVFIYMLGILIGARIGRNSNSLPLVSQLKAIGVLQVLLGAMSYCSFHFIKGIGALGATAALPQLLYYGLVCLPILIPTTIMGMLTPLMVSSLTRYGAYGFSVGLSYGLNVAGAAIGALGTGLLMIGAFGLHATLATMALVDVFIGLTVYGIVARMFSEKVSPLFWAKELWSSKTASSRAVLGAYPRATLVMIAGFFLIGFAALGYEIFAFRLLGTIFGNSPYLFPILLFCYLVQLGLGTICGGAISRYVRFPAAFLMAAIGMIIASLATINLHGLLPQDRNFLILSDSYTSYIFQYPNLIVAIVLTYAALLPVFFMSMFMPLFVDRSKIELENVDFSFAYFWQTLGNSLGIIVTGLFLFEVLELPQVGTLMIVLALFGAILVFLVLVPLQGRQSRLATLAFSVTALVSLALGYPANFYQRITYRLSETYYAKPMKVYHDAQSLSLLYPKNLNSTSELALLANGTFYVTGILSEVRENEPNYVQPSFAGLAFNLNPNIRRVLFIGGAHFSEQLFAENRGARNTIIDINSHVFDATLHYGLREARQQVTGGETHVIDGRRFLGQSNVVYDYVHVGIDKATTAGSGNVFSREFLKIVSDHLTSDGVVTFYAYPTVVKAALEIYPDVAVVAAPNGNAIAIASKRAIDDGVMDRMRAAVADITSEEGAGARFIFKNFQSGVVFGKRDIETILAGIGPSTDNNLVTEFALNNRVEIFQGASSQNAPIDIRVWPVNALEYSRLAAIPTGSGIRLLSKTKSIVEATHGGLPFTLRRGGGMIEDSSAEVLSDGSVLMKQDLGSWFDWPYLGKPVGSQWEVAGNVRKLSDGPVSFLMRGKLSGRGLVGLKAFCGEEFVGSGFSYSEEIEIPLTTKEGADCSHISLHVSLDGLPGIGRKAEFKLSEIVGN